MRRTSKIVVTFMTLMVAVSLTGNMLAFANGDNGYETVGGEVAPMSFVTTFLVPAVVILGIFGAMIVLGVIRIKFKSDANKST